MVVIGVVFFLLQIRLPLVPLLLLVTWTAITNIGMWYWARGLSKSAAVSDGKSRVIEGEPRDR